ncbi:MAG TPA: autoinducer binding domain-containing protein [Paracoccaceae bacterium]|nr:autoinducer binding domain-containing protein [Paracoccaceae bacterium]
MSDLMLLAPTGYAAALHINFTTPDFLFQTYPTVWLAIYSQRGLVMKDPTVLWGFENLGTVRWSDLASLDHDGVMKEATKYGMKYGLTVAVEQDGTRSIASLSRADREFADDELVQAAAMISKLHDLTALTRTLTDETRAILRRKSIQFTHPS